MQDAEWDRMRLQHTSLVDTHLPVLRSQMQLVVHTTIKRMAVEGMSKKKAKVLDMLLYSHSVSNTSTQQDSA